MKKHQPPPIDEFDGMLFDFDGTLVDSMDAFFDAIAESYKNLGFDCTNEMVTDVFTRLEKGGTGKGTDDIYVNLMHELNEFFGIKDTKIFFDQILSVYRTKTKSISYRKGAAEFLVHLKRQGKGLGIVTSNGRFVMEHHRTKNMNIINAADLDYIFGDIIVTRDDVANKKPHPEPYIKGGQLIGAKNILVFEDSITGAKAAVAAGYKVCGIRDKSTDSAELQKIVHYYIDGFQQLGF